MSIEQTSASDESIKSLGIPDRDPELASYWSRDTGEYAMSLHHGIVLWKKWVSEKEDEEKRIPIQLANCVAEIRAETTRDDGTTRTKWIEMAIARPDVPERVIAVPTSDFQNNIWVGQLAAMEIWQKGQRDNLRIAIQNLSKNCVERTVYAHLGWRKVSNAWVYLHAGGGIGAEGAVDEVVVEVEGRLAGYLLPPPPEGEELRRVVTASLDLVNYGPDRIVFPGLAATYRAPLGNCHQSVFFTGTTGNGKSTWAGFLQAHFGATFSPTSLPANFDQDTANSLGELAHLAKDVLLTIDEFVPGKAHDDRPLRAKADAVLRSVANGSGRQRMRPDGTLLPDKPPRAFVLATGEDAPEGQSLRARMVIVHIDRDELNDVTQLEISQEHARNGDYAAAMSAYVRWLAPQMDTIQAERVAKVSGYRKLFEKGSGHRRSPDAAAELFYGFETFIRFAGEVGAIAPDKSGELLGRCVNALQQGIRTQATEIRDADPVHLFLHGVNECLGTRRAHLVSKTGGEPDKADAYGWREDNLHIGRIASGRMIGVVEGCDLWLSPTVAIGEVKKLYQDAGQTFGATTNALGRALAEKGVLASTTNGTPTVKKSIGGRDGKWWHLNISALDPGDPDDDDPDAQPVHIGSAEETAIGTAAIGTAAVLVGGKTGAEGPDAFLRTDNQFDRTVFDTIGTTVDITTTSTSSLFRTVRTDIEDEKRDTCGRGAGGSIPQTVSLLPDWSDWSDQYDAITAAAALPGLSFDVEIPRLPTGPIASRTRALVPYHRADPDFFGLTLHHRCTHCNEPFHRAGGRFPSIHVPGACVPCARRTSIPALNH